MKKSLFATLSLLVVMAAGLTGCERCKSVSEPVCSEQRIKTCSAPIYAPVATRQTTCISKSPCH